MMNCNNRYCKVHMAVLKKNHKKHTATRFLICELWLSLENMLDVPIKLKSSLGKSNIVSVCSNFSSAKATSRCKHEAVMGI